METFNAVMRALVFIVLTGTATVGIYAVPSAVAGVISLWGMINVIYYWLIPAIW